MSSINYPQLGQHKSEHQQFLKKFEEMADAVKQGRPHATSEFFDYTANWLRTHISSSDMAYVAFGKAL